jgi:hypothetical protein
MDAHGIGVILSVIVGAFNAILLVDLRHRISRLETLHMSSAQPKEGN